MISQIYRALMSIGLSTFVSLALVFGMATDRNSAMAAVHSAYIPIAAMERIEATTKDLEGKAQEAIGNVTGDLQNQVAGKIKQASAAALNASEDLKDQAKMPERFKAGAKDLEGKAQEAIGKLTGDRQDQLAGKAKQVDSSARNSLEDIKDAVNGWFKN
jgi:uncharacterized protein YjbJ (UPF0337 family)